MVRAGEFRYENHMRLALLEKVDNVQATGLGAGLDDSTEGHFTDGDSILRVVVSRAVDGNSGVSRRKNIIHCLFVEDMVFGKRVDVGNRCHDLSDGLVLQVQNGCDNGNLILVQSLGNFSQRLVEGDKSLETTLLVQGAVVLAQNPVEKLRNGP
ncbi:hypothetical protein HG531_010117 [Fusarium graminearum]|nr:hypothetical protein HG531_010117 [Fusarium graminearum]